VYQVVQVQIMRESCLDRCSQRGEVGVSNRTFTHVLRIRETSRQYTDDTVLYTNGDIIPPRYWIALTDILPQLPTNGDLIVNYVRLVLPCGVLDAAFGRSFPCLVLKGPSGILGIQALESLPQ
jgi:hypothetical protein